MDIKKFAKDNKTALIVGGVLLIIGILYFKGKKFAFGSNKGSGDLEGEDKKGGLSFEKGKDYTTFKIETVADGFDYANKKTFWIRYYKDKRFKILVVKDGKTEQPNSSKRGKYDMDGKRLFFEDGKTVEGTSITNVVDIIKNMSITSEYF